jgi:hypothetical protein
MAICAQKIKQTSLTTLPSDLEFDEWYELMEDVIYEEYMTSGAYYEPDFDRERWEEELYEEYCRHS